MNGGGYEHVSLGNTITREPLLARFIGHITKRLVAVHLPPYASGFTAIVAWTSRRRARRGTWRWRRWRRTSTSRQVILVDADIDVYDPAAVLWAMSTRVRWDQDLVPIPGIHGNELDPTADDDGVQCKTIIDATLDAAARERYVKVDVSAVDLASYLGGAAVDGVRARRRR